MTTPQLDTIATMTTKTTAKRSDGTDPRYAKGWNIHEQGNWWHDGLLPGTTSFLVRSFHGFCWASLANSGQGAEMRDAQDALMWKVVSSVSQWPTYDLFPRYDEGPWWSLRSFLWKYTTP